MSVTAGGLLPQPREPGSERGLPPRSRAPFAASLTPASIVGDPGASTKLGGLEARKRGGAVWPLVEVTSPTVLSRLEWSKDILAEEPVFSGRMVALASVSALAMTLTACTLIETLLVTTVIATANDSGPEGTILSLRGTGAPEAMPWMKRPPGLADSSATIKLAVRVKL